MVVGCISRTECHLDGDVIAVNDEGSVSLQEAAVTFQFLVRRPAVCLMAGRGDLGDNRLLGTLGLG